MTDPIRRPRSALILALATPVLAAGPATLPAVRLTVDTADAPDLAAFADRVKAVGEAEYPKIAALLASDGFTPPAAVTITFRRDYRGVAECSGDRITASARWFADHPDDEGAFVHELVHVVQHYGDGPQPGWLVEGIADYYRWFVYEPEAKRPRVDPKTARYDASYRTSAAFLDWCQRQYDPDLVRKLNAACREGRYDAALWEQATGKPLPELGEAWRKSLPRKPLP